jgi:branched-chain amino acid transport system substrate-binding protein
LPARPATAAPAAVVLAALFAALVILSGCGGDQSRGGEVAGDTLTIYSSVPLQGPHADQARAIVDGEKLALSEAGGKAGSYKVNFANLDDATAGDSRGAGWNPGRTADNASRAAEDARTIAYVGEFDSGASAISIPITNEAGFVQVSPAATAVGLTKLVPGADKGEPDKYYPSGDRTFARVIPADDVQASAAAAWAKDFGARRVFLVDDKSVGGLGLVKQFQVAAQRVGGIQIVGQQGMDPRAHDYRDFAKEVAKKDPDLVYFGGGVESNARTFWRDLGAGVPHARLMGSAGLLSPDFYQGLRANERTFLTSAAQDPRQLPQGQRFIRDYRRTFGHEPDPYAAYGHAAMSVVLDAIRRAGDSANQRGDIVDRVFDTKNFHSVVGTFSIDENGDTSLTRVAGYRVRNGRLEFVKGLDGTATG